MSSAEHAAVLYVVLSFYQQYNNRACKRVSHNALFWNSQTHSVNVSIFDFLSISGNSSEKLHCGDVVIMPYWPNGLMAYWPIDLLAYWPYWLIHMYGGKNLCILH